MLLQADSGEVEVQDGDIIVLATDGVWDNFAPNLMRAPTFQPVSPSCVMYNGATLLITRVAIGTFSSRFDECEVADICCCSYCA